MSSWFASLEQLLSCQTTRDGRCDEVFERRPGRISLRSFASASSCYGHQCQLLYHDGNRTAGVRSGNTLPPSGDMPGIDVMFLHLQVPGSATAYCKFHILHGEDWTKLDGMGEGLTQIARRCRGGDPCAEMLSLLTVIPGRSFCSSRCSAATPSILRS